MSISTREAKQSYHPKGYGVSEGLKRARAPFRTRNAIVGLALSGFMFSVYLYSIRAVAQDDFADLQAPTDEQRRNTVSIEDERRNRELVKSQSLDFAAPPPPPSPLAASAPVPLASAAQSSPAGATGVLARLRSTFGGRGSESQLVWGAPPVDRIGRIGRAEEAPITKRIV